ncbi:hypothetical protein ACSBR2_018605 [Camellia fascicularis]
MENDSYTTSNPDSGDSSPWSTEIDFENKAPWEEQPAPPPSSNYEVKFMCSYGGKFHPRPHDKKLSYIGGETKILAVDRNINFTGLIGKLSVLCHADVCFEYQLPGEDLDALISVTNDDDLERMMHEYDRLFRASWKPARFRLFLFPDAESVAAAPRSFGSSEGKSDRERRSDENLIGGFPGNNYYAQNFSEKLPPATLPAAPPPPVSSLQGYWPEKQLTSGGVYTAVPEQQQQQQQQVYKIQTPAGMYHAPMGRQMKMDPTIPKHSVNLLLGGDLWLCLVELLNRNSTLSFECRALHAFNHVPLFCQLSLMGSLEIHLSRSFPLGCFA